jgi:hypothetical protein
MSEKEYNIIKLNPELESNDQGDLLLYFDCPACQMRQNVNLSLFRTGDYIFCPCGKFSFYLSEDAVRELSEPPCKLRSLTGKIGEFR